MGHHWYPAALRFSSDSPTLYSSGWDGRVRRWDVRTLKQLPIPAGVPGSEVIVASPTGDEIAYADDVGGLHFVDAKDGKDSKDGKASDTAKKTETADTTSSSVGIA